MIALHLQQSLDRVLGNVCVDHVVMDATEEDQIGITAAVVDEMAPAFVLLSRKRVGPTGATIGACHDVALLADDGLLALTALDRNESLRAARERTLLARVRPQSFMRDDQRRHRQPA